MSTSYGPLAVSTTGSTKVTLANLSTTVAIIANESPFTLKCSIDGTGSTKWIQALTVDRVDIPRGGSGFTGNLIFTPNVVLTNTANAPSYALLVDAYGPHESPTGVYPIALPRVQNVGNQVQTNVSGASSLQNDGQAAGTSIIESTVIGSPQSNVLVDNSGNVTLAEYVASVRTVLLQVIAGAAVSLKLGASGRDVEVLGNLIADLAVTVAGTLTTNGGINLGSANTIKASNGTTILDSTGFDLSISPKGGAGNLVRFGGGGTLLDNNKLGVNANGDFLDASSTSWFIKGSGGGDLVLQCPNGNTRMTVKNNGNIALAGPLQFMNNNTLARSGDVAGSGSGTFNHNLGAVPDWVGLTTHAVGSQTMGYDSETSTNLHVTTGAGLAWFGILFKRT